MERGRDGGGTMPKIVPNLWFDTQAEEAANYYTSTFPDSKINSISHYGEAGPREAGAVLTVDFEIYGQQFTAINGGPDFNFNEAVSFLVNCDSQEEIDELWDKLVADGGKEIQCGWIKDKFGLAWQIIPTEMGELLSSGDEAATQRVMEAMLQMVKIDVKVLRDAANHK
jgi:predicted 3-demethylubiquinone-9 3-methyltransferase (glyoxalase superfamily)